MRRYLEEGEKSIQDGIRNRFKYTVLFIPMFPVIDYSLVASCDTTLSSA